MAGNRQMFEAAIKRGHALARQQAWDKAIVEYRRALAEFPNDLSALTAAASVLIKLKRLPDALTVLQHACQLKPDEVATLKEAWARSEQTMGWPSLDEDDRLQRIAPLWLAIHEARRGYQA